MCFTLEREYFYVEFLYILISIFLKKKKKEIPLERVLKNAKYIILLSFGGKPQAVDII